MMIPLFFFLLCSFFTNASSTSLALYSVAPFWVSFGTRGPTDSIDFTVLEAQFTQQTESFLRQSLAAQETSLQFEAASIRVTLHLGHPPRHLRTSLATSSSISWFWTLCETTLAFVEPGDPSTRPSNQEMRDIFEPLLTNIFKERLVEYRNALKRANEPLLADIVTVQVQTNADTSLINLPRNTDPQTTADNNNGWTNQEIIFLLLLLLVGAFAFAAVVLVVHRHLQYHKKLERKELYQDNLRHSEEVVQVLQASDRYLAKHRPDLYEAIQSTSPTSEGRSIREPPLIVPVPLHPRRHTVHAVERRYVTPKNPLEYLYGAGFMHRERNHAEPEDTTDPPVPFVAWLGQKWNKGHSSVPTDEQDQDFQQQRQLVNEELTIDFHDDDEQDDEELANYPFPYRDFPRHDGTPCLIYNENGSFSPPPPPPPPDAPLDNDTFQQVLSMQSSNDEQDIHDEHSYHLGEHESTDEDDSFIFRLENLVAMRYRQYQKSKQDEDDEEPQNNADYYYQCQLDLERSIQEIEAALSPPLETHKSISTNTTTASTPTPSFLSAPGGLEELSPHEQDNPRVKTAFRLNSYESNSYEDIPLDMLHLDPSPTSVVDDVATSLQTRRSLMNKRRYANHHRRSLSVNNAADYKPTHKRANSNSASPTHKRANSSSTSTSSGSLYRSHARSNSQGHRRANSSNNDVMTHGVYARFV